MSRDFLDRCHSLAVLGGTFDPIHRGHLAVAEAVLAQFKPQRVLFMPCGVVPHKDNETVSPAEHRYNMTLLATCTHPFFDVSRLEIDQDEVSYTIHTVRLLKAECPADADIYWVVGADALAEILTWKDIGDLFKLCKFIAVPRPGITSKHLKELADDINTRYGECILMLDMPKVDISSTALRRQFSEGKNVHAFMPRLAEDYARLHNLYRGPVSFDEVKDELERRLSPKRFIHTLGVVEEAEKLARHYGADVEKARWAALLHDCAKEYSTEKKRTLCKTWGIELDDSSTSLIDLSHGAIGAQSARRDYGITDPEILQAIHYHSTGHGNMTLLDKIIALADFIDPYREDYPPLAQMRTLAYENINKSLRVGIKYTVKEQEERNNPLHPDGLAALEALKKNGEMK